MPATHPGAGHPDASARKEALRAELARALESELATLEQAHAATREAATHEEAKPENDKDTRALEQSYVARGQAMRIEEARGGLADVRAMRVGPSSRVSLGALATLDEGGARTQVFVAPAGGGVRLDDARVHVITPQAPLGRALLGKVAGDVAELHAGGRTREIEVVDVA